MSVWKDREGRYHAAVQRRGKRVHRICAPKASWREAKAKEAEILRDFDALAAERVLIGQAIQHWLDEEVAHQKAKRRTESNAYALADWVEGKPLTEIHLVAETYKQDARKFLANPKRKKRLTNSTINRRLAVLKRVASLAYKRWGWLTEPLAQKIELLPENPARERYLDRDELAKLLRAIPDRTIRRAALLAAFTGLRRGELVRLRAVHVQGDLIYVRQGKNGRSRTVPAVDHIRFALKRLPLAVHADTLTHAVQAAMPGTRFHDLRHTAASMLIQAGVPLYTVGTILGHSDARTTKRYAHLAVDSLREAMGKLGKRTGSAQGTGAEEGKKAA